MAIYHLTVKPIQRSKGRSSVAAAAYRSGSKLVDHRTRQTYNYSARKDVVFQALVGWNRDRATLWNEAEIVEKRKDATTAREYEVAIPKELSQKGQENLVYQYGLWLHDEFGVAVDICVHAAKQTKNQKGQLQTNGNVHAHIMTTTRRVEHESRLTDKVPREWSDTRRKREGLPGRKNELLKAREQWARVATEALRLEGVNESIDHRSYEAQGLEFAAQIHVGVRASAIQRNGQYISRGIENDEKKVRQSEIRSIDAELSKLDRQKYNLQKFLRFSPQKLKTSGAYPHHQNKDLEDAIPTMQNSKKPEWENATDEMDNFGHGEGYDLDESGDHEPHDEYPFDEEEFEPDYDDSDHYHGLN